MGIEKEAGLGFPKLYTYGELKQFILTTDNIKVFGAGDTAVRILYELSRYDPELLDKIKCITASKIFGKPSQMYGIPVVQYEDANINEHDHVLLAVKEAYYGEVGEMLGKTGAIVIVCSGGIICEKVYQKAAAVLQPLVAGFPGEVEQLLPSPVATAKPRAWTMWWQGEENAPEIVKACFRSQRKNLPDGVEHVIITEKNYFNYVKLPDYILEKVHNGSMLMAHLSDLIRWLLLYQYGGLWMDATILVLQPLPKKIFEYPICTRVESIPTAYHEIDETDINWVIYFMGGRSGHSLFQFLSAVFLWYLESHESIMDVDYFMSDHAIRLAYATYPDVRRDMDAIPKAEPVRMLKVSQLYAQYSEEEFLFYTRDQYWCKLSHHQNWENHRKEGTIYEYICENF